jgi:hypothetical protein
LQHGDERAAIQASDQPSRRHRVYERVSVAQREREQPVELGLQGLPLKGGLIVWRTRTVYCRPYCRPFDVTPATQRGGKDWV